MSSIIWWMVAMAMLAAAVAVAAVLIKAYLNGETPAAAFFKPRRGEPRLAVVEHASVDGKRRLVLIRRDDVEHLILTGGPVDVVVETGIGAEASLEAPRTPDAYREPVPAANPPVFTRAPRAFGQAAQTSIEEVEAALKR